MAWQYDLLVVGTGTAASVAARRCRSAGWSVAVVDHRPFGGTCALRGCEPKKLLVDTAAAVDLPRRLAGRGVAGGEPAIDWPALMRIKRSFTDPVPESRARSFAEAGIETLCGTARFTGPNELDIAGNAVKARYVLLATGAEPVPLGFPGAEHLATSDDFLGLEALPQRVLFVGAGYIGFELAHVARRAGAAVTMLEKDDRVLGPFDPDLVGWLVEKTRKLGIALRTGTAVAEIERRGDAYAVQAVADGARETIEADLVVHAAGRAPALAALDLEAAGVQKEDGRLKLNQYLQSVSNAAVYAAGDAARQGPPLTPVASHDGGVVAANLLRGNHMSADYSGVPSIVFTIPPLASVGLREQDAAARGLRYRIRTERTAHWAANRRLNEDAAGFKIIVEEDTGRILGAHLLGPHADELVNIFGLAIRTGLTADELKSAIFGYPTSASSLESML